MRLARAHARSRTHTLTQSLSLSLSLSLSHTHTRTHSHSSQVLEIMAALHGVTDEELAKILRDNTLKIFPTLIQHA